MLIVAGYLTVESADRDKYVEMCVNAVEAARAAAGCLDYAITADTVDCTKVRIFERWDNVEDLLAFRGSGPSDAQQAAILDADVKRYEISSVGDA